MLRTGKMLLPSEADWTHVCEDTLTSTTPSSEKSSLLGSTHPCDDTSPRKDDVSQASKLPDREGSDRGVMTATAIPPDVNHLIHKAASSSKAFTLHLYMSGPTSSQSKAAPEVTGATRQKNAEQQGGMSVLTVLSVVVLVTVCVCTWIGLEATKAQVSFNDGNMSDARDQAYYQLRSAQRELKSLRQELQEASERLADLRQANAVCQFDLNHISNVNRELSLRESSRSEEARGLQKVVTQLQADNRELALREKTCAKEAKGLQKLANRLQTDKYQLRKEMSRCWC